MQIPVASHELSDWKNWINLSKNIEPHVITLISNKEKSISTECTTVYPTSTL